MGPVKYRVLDKYCEQILGILKAGPLNAGAKGRKKNTQVNFPSEASMKQQLTCLDPCSYVILKFVFFVGMQSGRISPLSISVEPFCKLV